MNTQEIYKGIKIDIPEVRTELNNTNTTLNIKTGFTLNINEFPRLNNENDDSYRFQRAIDLLQQLDTVVENRNNRGGKLIVPAGDYYFYDSIYLGQSKDTSANIPFPIHICGEVNAFEGHTGLGVNFYAKTNKPVFSINLDKDGNSALKSNGYGHITIENINFTTKDEDKAIANKSTGIRLFMTRIILKNITCQSMYSLIDQPQKDNSGKQTYSDLWQLENIRFRNLRGKGVVAWYCDNLIIKGIYSEYSERATNVLDLYSCNGFSIDGFLCAMNERYNTGADVYNSSMISCTTCRGTITNIYVENILQFQSFLYLGNSNVIVNSYVERFEGNNAFYLYESQLQLNGSEFESKRNANTYDFKTIGGINSQSRIVLTNTNVKEVSRPNGWEAPVVTNPRNFSYSFSGNSVSLYSDDIKSVRVKYDSATKSIKVRDYNNTKDFNYGTYTIDENGISFNNDSILRYKKVNGITPVFGSYTPINYGFMNLTDGFGGYIKFCAFKFDGSPIVDWKTNNAGTDKNNIDFIIHFE